MKRLPLIITALWWPACSWGQHPAEHEQATPPHEQQTAPFEPIEDNREASGTAWQPAASPMYAHHFTADSWSLMLHYNAFLIYNHQGGPRGDDQFASTNWAMLMARRPAGRGRLTLRGMFSLERATTGGDGYPLLFQSGESWNDEPLVDRQHPHDLFMELAARYDLPMATGLNGLLYVAPVGEPALGPVAYPHRLSAWNYPLAPLGHHWQDSTHITFGVVTAGIYGEKWQAETSTFTGREPDEDRWDIDPIRLDSYSGRLTYNPGEHWSLSASRGFLESPEALHPGEDVTRTTASALYTRPLGRTELFAAAAVWGRNDTEGDKTDSYLLEASYTLRSRNQLFLRLEAVEKSGEELSLEPPSRIHRIEAATLGYSYDFYQRATHIGVGAGVTFHDVPRALRADYGDDPVSYVLFLRIRPSQVRERPGH